MGAATVPEPEKLTRDGVLDSRSSVAVASERAHWSVQLNAIVP